MLKNINLIGVGVVIGLLVALALVEIFRVPCEIIYSTKLTNVEQPVQNVQGSPSNPAPVPPTQLEPDDARTPEWDLDDIGTVFIDEETKVILFSPIGAKEQVVLLDPEPGILGKVSHFDTLEIRAVGGNNNTYLICEFRRPRSFLNGVEEPATPWVVAMDRKDACP